MFPRWKNFPRSGARALTKLLLALAFVFAAQTRAEAAGTLIPAPGRVDMVHDSARDTLYITSGGSVLRYHLGTNSFLSPFSLGGNLAGLDLSPDGDTLVVADRTRDASNIWVHVVDLKTGASSKVNFPRYSLEGGTFTVAYGADNHVLVTSTFEGSGWIPLRRLDPATGAWTALTSLFPDVPGGTITQNTMLAASGDRSVVGFAEANISDGRWGRYRVSDANVAHRTWYENGTGWFNYEIGVNKDGTQFAIPTYGGTFIYNSNFVKVATLGQYAGAQPIGVVYHPVEDIVYFPWTTTTEVRAFNTNTFAQVGTYYFEDTFTGNGNHAFQQGRMKMSRDGSLLFATVTGGVRFVRLYAPLSARDDSIFVLEDSSVTFNGLGGVGNGAAVSFRAETQPAHGTVTVAGGRFTYTPEANYYGPDSFTYRAVYGPAQSALATVNITVDPSNDPPAAEDQTVTVDEDGVTAVTLTAVDLEGDAVNYQLVSVPAHGTLTGVVPNLVYTPLPNYSGPDSFTFRVNDGEADSNVATASVVVNAVNDVPVANGQAAALSEDSSVSITLTASDADGDPVSYLLVGAPAHGSLSGAAPNLVYTPARDYSGGDSFTFVVSDGKAQSAAATVNVSVAAVNDAPTAAGDSATVLKNSSVGVTVLANDRDADGDALTVVSVTQGTNGTVTVAPGGKSVTYTPRRNYLGNDAFSYAVSDGRGGTATATVNVLVRK